MSAPSTLVARAVNTAWWARSTPAALRFRRALGDPRSAQESLLRHHLERDADTVFGRDHSLDRSCSLETWRRRVPVRHWQELEPWLARVRRGEPRVLTGSQVTRLMPTSGTSQARKLVPYTPALLAEMQNAIGAWIAGLFYQRRSLLGGPAYWSVSPAIVAESPSETGEELPQDSPPIGFDHDSAYLGGRLARWVERALAVPSAVRWVIEPEAFRYTTLRFLLEAAELRLVSVWHPSFLELLLDALAPNWEALVRDLADGTLSPPSPLEPAVIDALKPRLRRRPRRAAALERADPSRPTSLWPRLGLVSCWADGPANFPARRLAERLPGVSIEAKGLVATEAFISLPFAGQRPAAVSCHLLELEDDCGRCGFLWEAEEGQVYTVVVTTGGGLHRYRLGDRVRVSGFLGKTPSLEFVGRGATSDLCGEKLVDGFVATAIAKALEPYPSTPAFVMLAPDPAPDGSASYTLYLEPCQERRAASSGEANDTNSPSPWPPASIALALDRELARNPHWELCRRLGQLGPPRLFHVRTGGHATFTERQSQAGCQLGGIKPTFLSSDDGWSEHFKGHYTGTSNGL